MPYLLTLSRSLGLSVDSSQGGFSQLFTFSKQQNQIIGHAQPELALFQDYTKYPICIKNPGRWLTPEFLRLCGVYFKSFFVAVYLLLFQMIFKFSSIFLLSGIPLE